MDNKGLSSTGFFVGIAWLTLIIFGGVFAIGALIKYEMNQMRVAMGITVPSDHAAHGDGHMEDAHGGGPDDHGQAEGHHVNAHVSSAHGDGHGEGESHGDGHHKDSHGHSGKKAAVADDPNKPEPIVPEGENIVINPAGAGGTRYLLVEIFLLRKDVEDTDFPMEVSKHTKKLQAVTVGHLSREDAQSLANPAVKERLKTELKKAYQDALGKDHPIKELIVSKWIMQ